MKHDPSQSVRHVDELPFEGDPGPLQRLFKDQRFLFLMVGGANTAFSTMLFAALIVFLPSIPASVSVCIAWAVALLLFFFVYRRLVFRVRGHVWLDLARFAGVNVFGLLVHVGCLLVLVDLAGLPAIPVQVTTTVVVVAFNYLAHKYFSFRRSSR